MNASLRQTLVIASLGMTVTINALANILPINGITTGDRSDSFNILFVPAGYVFSIWGVIYTGLIAYAIFQALPKQKNNERLKAIAPWFMLNMLANSLWIFAWHYNALWLSVVLMLIILATLIMTYRILNNDKAHTRAEKWTTQIPFSIYLGWISVATVANVSTALFNMTWTDFGLGAVTWFIIMSAIALVLGILFLSQRKDFSYTGVLVWAFIGIAVKHWNLTAVAYTAILVIAVLSIGILYQLMNKNKAMQMARA